MTEKELEKDQEEEFNCFCNWFYEYKKSLGLQGWAVQYIKRMDYAPKQPYAQVNYILDQREAWVYWWGSNDTLSNVRAKSKALHEVLHLLFAPCQLEAGMEHTLINSIIDGLR